MPAPFKIFLLFMLALITGALVDHYDWSFTVNWTSVALCVIILLLTWVVLMLKSIGNALQTIGKNQQSIFNELEHIKTRIQK